MENEEVEENIELKKEPNIYTERIIILKKHKAKRKDNKNNTSDHERTIKAVQYMVLRQDKTI